MWYPSLMCLSARTAAAFSKCYLFYSQTEPLHNFLSACSMHTGHRVKSIAMAKFTPEEVKRLQEGGNEVSDSVPQIHKATRTLNDNLAEHGQVILGPLEARDGHAEASRQEPKAGPAVDQGGVYRQGVLQRGGSCTRSNRGTSLLRVRWGCVLRASWGVVHLCCLLPWHCAALALSKTV